MTYPKTWVRFHLNLEQLEKRSGRYDAKLKLTAQKIHQHSTEILGLSDDGAKAMYRAGSALVTCSADTFVRWLLWRCEAGFVNGFRELKVAEVPAPLTAEGGTPELTGS